MNSKTEDLLLSEAWDMLCSHSNFIGKSDKSQVRNHSHTHLKPLNYNNFFYCILISEHLSIQATFWVLHS